MSSPLFIAKLVASEGTRATVEHAGKQVSISIALVPDAEVGDEVLVQRGFALRRMTEASETAPEGILGREMEFPPADLPLDL